MKIKQLFITGMIPMLATGSILAGCSGSQNQTANGGDQTTTSADNVNQEQAASSGAQEATTVAENNDTTEKDDKTYNIVEYILSGKPYIRLTLFNKDATGKNNYFKVSFMINDNKLYDYGLQSTDEINITLGDYANTTDEEFFNLFLNNKEPHNSTPLPFVIAVFSDKTGNNLGLIRLFYKDYPESNDHKDYHYSTLYSSDWYDYEYFTVYDSEFVVLPLDNYYPQSYRLNKPFKSYGTLEDYKNMDGVLMDPTDDEIKAALGI